VNSLETTLSKEYFRKSCFDASLRSMSTDPRADLRTVRDARALRALAHPIRITLLEAVALSGPLTATEAARIVGGTVANAAYHLRTLAKYDYIVEAEGGTGRERPWKIASVGMSFHDDDPNPAVAHAAHALGEVMVNRWLRRIRSSLRQRDQYPEAVRAIGDSSQYVLIATPAEVVQAQGEIMSILIKYAERITDPASRPDGSIPFEMLVFTHPLDLSAPVEPEG
jgi:predicted transcriptional regulator